jgi:hypothetical protein
VSCGNESGAERNIELYASTNICSSAMI